MTPPSDRETLEEIADRIAGEWFEDEDQSAGALVDAIVSALRNERERCAKVAEDHYEHAIECDGGQSCSLNIADAIRKGE